MFFLQLLLGRHFESAQVHAGSSTLQEAAVPVIANPSQCSVKGVSPYAVHVVHAVMVCSVSSELHSKNTSQGLWLLASINAIYMKCNGYSYS